MAPVDSLQRIDLRIQCGPIKCATLEVMVVAFDDFMYVSARQRRCYLTFQSS